MAGWARREEGAAGPRGGLPPRQGGCLPVLTPAALPSCRYWDDFHACTLTALTDCQEGATDLWEKLRRESKNLDFQGSLFELCGGGSGAAPSLLPPALPLLLAALWAALVTWLPF
ncbi:neuritin [Cyanistes caeruleus]|uniref:neuritin n=1 Tax=Cyanistes caeruleus TaxID=156563 RepID=UPI000CDAD06B|nr:neuritin [Cyanistes caeruleus]